MESTKQTRPKASENSDKLDSVLYAIKFYKKMPKDLQEKHADRYKRVLELKEEIKSKSK